MLTSIKSCYIHKILDILTLVILDAPPKVSSTLAVVGLYNSFFTEVQKLHFVNLHSYIGYKYVHVSVHVCVYARERERVERKEYDNKGGRRKVKEGTDEGHAEYKNLSYNFYIIIYCIEPFL